MTTQVENDFQQKVYNSLEQAKGILTDTAQQAQDTLTEAHQAINVNVQSAIASSAHDWLINHPQVLRLLEILIWGTNHPIISIIILLFAIALFWSLIKAIGRFIETLATSLLQAPLKLSQALLKFSANTLGKLGATFNQSPQTQIVLQDPKLIKQQRLAEISTKLAAIQQEQNQLLQEVAEIIALDKDHNHRLYEQPANEITNHKNIDNSHLK